MPITYTNSDHVRTHLVAQGKQWRTALTKVRTSKHEGVKGLASTVEEVVEELTAGIIHCTSECEKQSSRVEHLEEGVNMATEQAVTVFIAQDEIKREFNALEQRLETTTKKNEALIKKVEINTLNSQRSEMAKCVNVIICRGIRYLKQGAETYEDMEKSFWQAIKPTKMEKHLTINYIGRLQKAPNDNPKYTCVVEGCARVRGAEEKTV